MVELPGGTVRTILLLSLVACTPDELAAALDRADAALLEEGAGAEVVERATLARHGEGRLSEHGAAFRPLDPEDARRFWLLEDELPIVEPGERLRTVLELDGVRLLVWLDRDDFEARVYEGAWAAPRPGSETEAGIWLPAGWTVDEPALGWARAVVESPIVAAEVWVASEAVDEVHLPAPVAEGWGGPDNADADVFLRGTDVRDAPGGEVFARISSDDMHWLGAVVLDEGEDWLEVRFGAEGGAIVRGFVDRDAARAWATGGRGWSRCGGSFRMGGGVAAGYGAPDLLEGTPLYDGPGGALVGVTTRDLWVPLDADDDGATFAWETPYGVVDLWVEAEQGGAAG